MQSVFETIQAAAVCREYREALEDGNLALADRIRRINPDVFNRVLVEVSGGMAQVSADPGIRVLIVDYDNEPEAEVPAEFLGLADAG